VELQRRVEELTELKSRLEQDNAYLLDEIRSEHNFGEMIGSSPRFLELAERIRLVARTSATVLISGKPGPARN
jgi:transcriptional regulator with GAF, ATPase, and Fis domain